jgi:hypothetical protein
MRCSVSVGAFEQFDSPSKVSYELFKKFAIFTINSESERAGEKLKNMKGIPVSQL